MLPISEGHVTTAFRSEETQPREPLKSPEILIARDERNVVVEVTLGDERMGYLRAVATAQEGGSP